MRLLLIFLFASSIVFGSEASYFDRVQEAKAFLLEKSDNSHPELIVVLTAGVEGIEKLVTEKKELFAKDIPHFPIAKAEGHEGKLIFGKLDGKEVVLLKGRYHFYEGISSQEVVFPYFVLNAMGAHSVITCNAVGGIRHDLNSGDIMMVTDHINYLGDNCLRGIAIERPGNQFTDMTEPYTHFYQNVAQEEAKKLGISLKTGIYLATSGPNYETRSEIRMFRTWGADAVGMSTVFEVLASNFMGMRVLAFCCIANPAADRHEGEMSHEEVLEAMRAAGPKLSSLLTACARKVLAGA
ncbi:MAG: Purine nucleoside phosphorylase 1 [Chlamydiae bacterium]|nr:Purine nucleoside phosphorylase 1 [Chlamydiota bacterium]